MGWADAAELSKGAALCRSRIEAELVTSEPITTLEVSEEGWGKGLVSTDIIFDVKNRRGERLRKTGSCKIRTLPDGAVRLEEFFMPLQAWELLGDATRRP